MEGQTDLRAWRGGLQRLLVTEPLLLEEELRRRESRGEYESKLPFMLSIDCGGQMKILLTLTEVKGAGGVETSRFPHRPGAKS